MAYKSYWMERQIMSDVSMTPAERFGALVLAKRMDWNTGVRKFKGKNHMNNWLMGVGAEAGLSVGDLQHVVATMQANEHARIENNTLTLLVWDDEDE